MDITRKDIDDIIKSLEPKFKVGDKVKIVYGQKAEWWIPSTNERHGFDFRKDLVGKIVIIDRVGQNASYGVRGTDDNSYWFYEDQLELIN